MSRPSLKIVILGLSITSSWGNGHAATYRGLIRGLSERGHKVLFIERDMPWYAENRDMSSFPFCEIELYSDLGTLMQRFAPAVHDADLVIVGSYVPEGIAVSRWVMETAGGKTAFYDIDTPVTVKKLAAGECEYLTPELIPRFDVYLSFTGGPTLERLEKKLGARMARPLYCSVDPDLYRKVVCEKKWDFGYMGTYSLDRQPTLDKLMIQPARTWKQGRFIVAGPQYPDGIKWPRNIKRIIHLSPREHCGFYNSQRFTLNVTRADMIRAGYSPSVRLFEAALCGTPIISDYWEGLDEHFQLDSEILVSDSPRRTLEYLREMPEEDAWELGEKARVKVLARHTPNNRARELEDLILGPA